MDRGHEDDVRARVCGWRAAHKTLMSLTSSIPRQNGADGQPLNPNSGLFGFAVPNTDAGADISAQLAAGSEPAGRLTANLDLLPGDVMVSVDGHGRCTITGVDVRGSLVTISHEFGSLEASANGFTRLASPEPDPVTVDSVFTGMLETTAPEFWTGLAEDERTPHPILHLMAVHGDADLRRAVGDNDGAAESTRDLLSRDEDPDVRAATIYWWKADSAFLSRFDGDDEYSVIEALGRAKGIDPEQLRRVAAVEYSSAYDILRNPATPTDLFAELYAAADPLDRRAALSSDNATAAFIEAAAADAHPSVRAAAMSHHLASAELLAANRDDPAEEVLLSIGRSSTCDGATSDHLLANASEAVREVVHARLRRTWH